MNFIKTMRKTRITLLSILSAFIILTSCSSDEKAKFQVRLTDAPGDFDEVNIDIQKVEVHAEDGNPSNGWVTLEGTKAGVYNLLDFSNGVDTLLGSVSLPAGMVSQVRLVLGSNNSIKVNGTTYDLNVPSGSTSGLKINIHQTLEEGLTYTVVLDFDAARSIVQSGNSNYHLKPVIRAIAEATDGAIKGVVNPVASTPAVMAITGTDTVSTFADQTTGKFLIKGLKTATYRVVFSPATGYQTKTVENVEVTVGQVKDMGTVEIIQ
jgi:hypothetical protein